MGTKLAAWAGDDQFVERYVRLPPSRVHEVRRWLSVDLASEPGMLGVAPISSPSYPHIIGDLGTCAADWSLSHPYRAFEHAPIRPALIKSSITAVQFQRTG
jgi:hypothetical protein